MCSVLVPLSPLPVHATVMVSQRFPISAFSVFPLTSYGRLRPPLSDMNSLLRGNQLKSSRRGSSSLPLAQGRVWWRASLSMDGCCAASSIAVLGGPRNSPFHSPFASSPLYLQNSKVFFRFQFFQFNSIFNSIQFFQNFSNERLIE